MALKINIIVDLIQFDAKFNAGNIYKTFLFIINMFKKIENE